jgi:hypothetical protein
MTVYSVGGTRPKSGKRPAIKVTTRSSKRATVLFAVAIVVVCAAVGASVLPPLFSSEVTTVPDELVGVWGTKAKNYADRTFEISKTTVLFRTGTGESEFTFHEIADIEQEADSKAVHYTLVYADGLKFSFRYERLADAIRFENQPEFAWTRQDDEPTTIAAIPSVALEPPDSEQREQVADPTEVVEQNASPVDPDASGETELIREVFSYRGVARDPFTSLMQTNDIKPFLRDLRITGIAFDPQSPGRSVAVLRDTVANKAYPVHVGDELGRMRVASIAPREVVLIVSEFGSEREVVLRQRGKQTL